MWWWVSAVAVLVLVGVYVFWVAGRIDRSHARAQAAQAALDAHLVRRAAAAVEAAESLGDSRLRWAGRVALEADPDEREAAENDLTRVLRPVLTASHDHELIPGGAPVREAVEAAGAAETVDLSPREATETVDLSPREATETVDLSPREATAELVRASRRVALARQVHNDVVRDALALRRRRVVRVLRLARKHPVPTYFDIDDPQA